jgi:hypothetical protein
MKLLVMQISLISCYIIPTTDLPPLLAPRKFRNYAVKQGRGQIMWDPTVRGLILTLIRLNIFLNYS